MAWRYRGSCTSPAAKTPFTLVWELPGTVLIYPSLSSSSWPSKSCVLGWCPIPRKKPNARSPSLHRGVAHQRAGHPVLITEYLDGRIAEQHFDIGSLHHAFLHRLRSTQVVFAYHHIHFVAQRRQIGRLFTGGIAAADYDDILFAVEKTRRRSHRPKHPCPCNAVPKRDRDT